MGGKFNSVERAALAACCVLALLLFFFPLLTIQLPLAGEQEITGSQVSSKVNDLRKQLGNLSKHRPAKKPSPPSVPSAPSPQRPSPGASVANDLPVSVKIGWLIPIAVTIAFLSAAATLVCAFFSVKMARWASTVGACSAAIAVLHVSIMNSDIHSWFADTLKLTAEELNRNLFAALAQGLGSLVVNAFQIKPGWGLYSLLLLLGVSMVIAFSRVLSRWQIASGSNAH